MGEGPIPVVTPQCCPSPHTHPQIPPLWGVGEGPRLPLPPFRSFRFFCLLFFFLLLLFFCSFFYRFQGGDLRGGRGTACVAWGDTKKRKKKKEPFVTRVRRVRVRLSGREK